MREIQRQIFKKSFLRFVVLQKVIDQKKKTFTTIFTTRGGGNRRNYRISCCG